MKNSTFIHSANFFLILSLIIFVSISCKNSESAKYENASNINTNIKPADNFRGKNLEQLKKEARQLGGEIRKQQLFEVSYNKFNNGTSIGFNPFVTEPFELRSGVLGNLSFDVRFYFAGDELKAPADDYSFTIHSYAESWKFSNSSDLIFLIDNERLKIGEGRRESSISDSGKVHEHLHYKISRSNLERIANAKVVELQVGIEQVQMNGHQLKLIRNLLILLS